MQPSAAIATAFVQRRRADGPGHYLNHPNGPAPARAHAHSNASKLVSKPVKLASDKDFYLDALFNPVWMSGPHVFSFAKDGTVVRPDTYSTEPYPGYRAGVALSSRRHTRGAGAGVAAGAGAGASSRPSRSLSIPRTHIPKPMDKPWKNVAITEQDEAEFAAMEAEAEVRAQAEAKSKLVGLVYTWPPRPQPAPCAECEVLMGPPRRGVVGTAGTGTRARVSAGKGTQGSAVPALSYGSSGESESESEMFRMVSGRRAMEQRKEVPLEKSVGFGRVQQKAPAPLQVVLGGTEDGEGEDGRTLCGVPRETGKVSVDELSSAFMPEQWVEDELTVRLRNILRIPDV